MCWLVRTSKDLGGRPPLASRCISLWWLFFHGGNTGSNPVGDANKIDNLSRSGFSARICDHDRVTIEPQNVPVFHRPTLVQPEKTQAEFRAKLRCLPAEA